MFGKKQFFLFVCTMLLITSCTQKNANNNNTSSGVQNINTQQISDFSPEPSPSPPNDGLLGSYVTNILDREKNRVNNIKLASQAIDGYTLQPGEIFSFNGALGKRKPEKGYKKARIILNGKSGEGTGGGICQVSSTLFNAVQLAGLEVIERHPHDRDVHYVPRGQDATVVYGDKDFKFKNTKKYPVEIRTTVENNKVHISIYEVKQP